PMERRKPLQDIPGKIPVLTVCLQRRSWRRNLKLPRGGDCFVIVIVWEFWSERRDLNPRPLDPQSSALPGCATLRTGQTPNYSGVPAQVLFSASAQKPA